MKMWIRGLSGLSGGRIRMCIRGAVWAVGRRIKIMYRGVTGVGVREGYRCTYNDRLNSNSRGTESKTVPLYPALRLTRVFISTTICRITLTAPETIATNPTPYTHLPTPEPNKQTFTISKKVNIPCGTRTHSLWIRSPTRCLGMCKYHC